MKEYTLNGKYKLKLPESRKSQWSHKWEYDRIDALLSEISEYDIVADIGAECGDISALIQKETGCDMILIEPSSDYWPMIRSIWSENGLKDPYYKFCGFAGNESNYDNSTDFRRWPEFGEFNDFKEKSFRHLNEKGDISVIKLDDMLYKNGYSPTVLNIDVEGSELEVLKGAEKILSEGERVCVFVSIHPEFMFDRYGYYTADLIAYMDRLGYEYLIMGFDHEFHFFFEQK